MKKHLALVIICLLFSVCMQGQTLIATSHCIDATANKNQRKIVRDTLDNVYVVYHDSLDGNMVVKGLFLNRETETWSESVVICNGKNPTIAISRDCKFFLIYETNDIVPMVAYISSFDFIQWTEELIISEGSIPCRFPIADVDSAGNVHVFWQKIYNPSLYDHLLEYARLVEDTVQKTELIEGVSDCAMACHLQYGNNTVYFAIGIGYDVDMSNAFTLMYRSADQMETWGNASGQGVMFGSNATISYNTEYWYDMYHHDCTVKFLYTDYDQQLVERNYIEQNNTNDERIIQSGPIDYHCIDDILPPLGYSYLFLRNNTLYHAFSYGYDTSPILETITNNPFNPSICYKHFRATVVDFIWMQEADEGYSIYYMRDDKFDPLGVVPIKELPIHLTAYPNPFANSIRIEAVSPEPELEFRIYDINARIVHSEKLMTDGSGKYTFSWTPENEKPGEYVVACFAGEHKAAGKIFFKP